MLHLNTLYYALIHPLILYQLIAALVKKKFNLLIKGQKRAVRIIKKAKYNAHTQPIFALLNILPLPKLIYQQKLHLIHAFITCQTLLKTSYCWITKFMFIIIFLESIEIFSNTKFLKRFPFYSFPLAWNNLPNNLKNISSKKFSH